MQPRMLRLRAAGTAMVPHFEKLQQGVRQFIGRELQEIAPGEHGFVPIDRVDEVPNRAEYREAVKAGDAEAADEATAHACGVTFTKPASAAAKDY